MSNPLGHLGAVGLEPVEVLDLRAMNRPALEKVAPAEDGLRFAQVHEVTHEFEQRTLFAGELPIEPGDRRILAISVVVAVLRLTKFIARKEHRHTLREEQGGEEVPLLSRRAVH